MRAKRKRDSCRNTVRYLRISSLSRCTPSNRRKCFLKRFFAFRSFNSFAFRKIYWIETSHRRCFLFISNISVYALPSFGYPLTPSFYFKSYRCDASLSKETLTKKKKEVPFQAQNKSLRISENYRNNHRHVDWNLIPLPRVSVREGSISWLSDGKSIGPFVFIT